MSETARRSIFMLLPKFPIRMFLSDSEEWGSEEAKEIMCKLTTVRSSEDNITFAVNRRNAPVMQVRKNIPERKA